MSALRHWLRPRWWVSAVVLTLAVLLLWPALPTRLNLILGDTLLAEIRGAPHSRVVAIDDASIQEFGRWPWPRQVHAQLLQRLKDAGAQAVGYNVLFSEPAPTGEDGALAAALARSPGVVLPAAVTAEPGQPGQLLQALTPLRTHTIAGHVNTELDPDGRVRRLLLSLNLPGQRMAALPWAVLHGAPSSGDDLPGRRLAGSRGTPPLHDHEIILPPLAQAIPVISFGDAMRHPEALRGHAVFVGATAKGLGPEYVSTVGDLATPTPSPVLMAQAYEVLRAQRYVVAVPPWLQHLLAAMLLTPVLLWPLHPGRRSSWAPALTLLAPLGVSATLLWIGQWWWAPMATLLPIGAAAIAWATQVLLDSTRENHRLRQRAQATLEAVGEGVVVLDATGRIESLNPMASRMALSPNVHQQSFAQAFGVDSDAQEALDQAMAYCQSTGESIQIPSSLRFRSSQGQREMLITVAPLPDHSNQPASSVLALRDVTATVAAGELLRHAATHDALTNLPNRTLLADRLQQAISRAVRAERKAALLFMDLDRFKRINDSLGHTVGDEVLCEVARRLTGVCRQQDTVARWGGDEFVLILEDIASREAVVPIAQKIVDTVGQDLSLAGMDFPCTCSLGIVMVPDEGCDTNALLAMADAAMYRAKANPTQRWTFFSSELNVWTRDRLALESDARQALQSHRFALHYQPQVDIRTGELVGFEALLRWFRDDGTQVPTGEFIAMAEESQLILQVGEWTLREAARQVACWMREGGPAVPVSVNISARQCLDRQLIGLVRDVLAETGIPPHRLKLEITETSAMTDANVVEELLEGIAQLGLGIALDDFGTGYSSLIYLRRFPIQQIKIDRRFVHDVAHDPGDMAIVKAIIGLAHGLGVPVVAEGVETEAQRAVLLREGCDILQGYLCARPLPAQQFTQWQNPHRFASAH